MEKILKNISWILVVLLAASIIYALLAGQYPITSLGVAAVLLIVTAVRAVFGSLKKADEYMRFVYWLKGMPDLLKLKINGEEISWVYDNMSSFKKVKEK